jgi:transcriptional regulator with XRE-family HTH domain
MLFIFCFPAKGMVNPIKPKEEKTVYKFELLERKRLERGLSYAAIAEQVGMNKVTVSRTLQGLSMKPRTVKLLADYLGVRMEMLVQ